MTVRIFTLLAALALVACVDEQPNSAGATDQPDAGAATDVDFADRGEASVGFTVLGDDDLAVKAWYPSASDAPEEITYLAQVGIFGPDSDPMPFFGEAIADAEPAQGPYPLVVLSHGFGLSPEWYHPLAEHLASHGFVVMAPGHVEYDWFTDVIPATVQRPLVISQTIDLASSGILDGAVDVERVSVIGHSYGGTTALIAGGAKFETSWMEEHCAVNEDPFVQSFFCDVFLGGTDQLADEMGLEETPAGVWPSLADDRVDAIVGMAPDAVLFGDVGLESVAVPAMLLGGTGDTAAPWSWGGELAYDHVSSETRAMVAFEGADHFVVTTTCDSMPWTSGLPAEYEAMFCEDPAWDKPAALDLTNETVAAFLSYTLRGDAAGREALAPSQFADIQGLQVRFDEPRAASVRHHPIPEQGSLVGE
ncbi:MAG: hypothetical protein KC912_24850 [Proteobacteria bacterium]|nr:hypothetical protein [Pseudomonadota bacterium]